MIQMTDRDYAAYLLGEDIDVDSQLRALRTLLGRHLSAETARSTEIDALTVAARGASGRHAERLVDLSIDEMHGSVFEDAAHSMAAASMLAPLLESLLVRVFDGVGRRPWPVIDSKRKRRAGVDHPDFWKGQIYFPSRGAPKANLLEAIDQLSVATGLKAYLPSDFGTALEALIAYRNAMFHNGFEWPVTARTDFAITIADKGWDAWFLNSKTGRLPWIFYMSPAFVSRSLDLVDETLEGVGRLVRDRTDEYGYGDPVDVISDEDAPLFDHFGEDADGPAGG